MPGSLENSAYEIAARLAAGGMTLGEYQGEDGTARAAIFVGETNPAVAAIGDETPVRARVRVIAGHGVYPVLAMLQIGGRLYETWLDFATIGDRKLFERLVSQPQAPVLIFDDGALSRTVPIETAPLRQSIDDTRYLLMHRHWARREFEAARAAVLARYPTLVARWDLLDDDARPGPLRVQ